MTPESEALPVDSELLNLRRCSNEIVSGAEQRRCNWHLFDEVYLLGDVAPHSPTKAGEVLRFKGLSCRSCGALQPDGIPPQVFAKLNVD